MNKYLHLLAIWSIMNIFISIFYISFSLLNPFFYFDTSVETSMIFVLYTIFISPFFMMYFTLPSLLIIGILLIVTKKSETLTNNYYYIFPTVLFLNSYILFYFEYYKRGFVLITIVGIIASILSIRFIENSLIKKNGSH